MSRYLLADIGGTYARFALATGHVVGPVWSVEVEARPTIIEAMRDFLAVEHAGAKIDGALLAVAGPVEGGRCRLTNAAWTIEEGAIAHAFKLSWVRVVNDLEAVAAGLPDLPTSQTRLVGPDTPLIGAPMAIISPGTGLGIACLLAGSRGRRVITSEGGHAAIAAIDEKSDKVVGILRRQFGRVSAERVLSGVGLCNLYQAIAKLEAARVASLTPAQVTAGAFDGSCPMCREAVDMFCALLGAVAGDLALMFGARGGIFIGGGIVPRFVDYVTRSGFRRQFENKGRLQSYLARIPVRVIMHSNPAFTGLLSLADIALAHDRRLEAR